MTGTPPLPEGTAYLNGEFVALAEAKVSVLDRGFIFGDGVYEVVPAYNRRPFRWAQHLARLRRSLGQVRISNPHTDEQWTGLVKALIERHPWDNQFVYLQVTRGVAKRDHGFPAGVTPTVFGMASALQPVPAEQRERGVAAVNLPDERWLHCDIKSISLLGNVLARQAALDVHCAECLLYRDSFLTEGSSANIWMVKGGRVYGVPKNNLVLEGIRFGLLEQLCAESGLPFELRPISRAEVEQADELLLSSATKEVVPITLLDGKPVGTGVPGPVYKALYTAYRAVISRS